MNGFKTSRNNRTRVTGRLTLPHNPPKPKPVLQVLRPGTRPSHWRYHRSDRIWRYWVRHPRRPGMWHHMAQDFYPPEFLLPLYTSYEWKMAVALRTEPTRYF